MTEEQLAAAGWETAPPLTRGALKAWQKHVGQTTAHVQEAATAPYRGHAIRWIGGSAHLRCVSDYREGSLAVCTHFAEHQARAIEAWLAGDEAGALEHARQALDPPAAGVEK